MKKFPLSTSLFTVLIFCSGLISTVRAQNIKFIPRDTVIYNIVNTEIIFYIDVTNITQNAQTVFVVRTANNLPINWQSSLCFESCFAPFLDSIATVPAPPYYSSPLQPGETREMSLHVFAINNTGTANIQLQSATFANPNDRITVDLTAIVNPVSVENENTLVTDYYLEQNYPNPFNPSTKINFGLKKAGEVEISVYNILGNKVATLVNGYNSAGKHSVLFNASTLSSGIYIYKIVTNEFTQSRKMLMLK